jgi:hypothetical protein
MVSSLVRSSSTNAASFVARLWRGAPLAPYSTRPHQLFCEIGQAPHRVRPAKVFGGVGGRGQRIWITQQLADVLRKALRRQILLFDTPSRT